MNNNMTQSRKRPVYTLVLSALFLALGIVLPFFTGQIPRSATCCCPCTCRSFSAA